MKLNKSCLLLYRQHFRVLPQTPTGFLPLDSDEDIGPQTPQKFHYIKLTQQNVKNCDCN